MSANWTPGPWEAEAEYGRGTWVGNANGEWAALACGRTDDEARANAAIIATAPTLYECLDVAINYVAAHAALTHDGKASTFLNKCTAVLFKAKGGDAQEHDAALEGEE
jgi:hypothetical protein